MIKHSEMPYVYLKGMSLGKAKILPLDESSSRPREEQAIDQVSYEQIIKSAQEGDEKAYKEIYDRYCRVVYTLAFQMVGNHTDADEIVQETFIRAFRNLRGLRNSRSFVSWLYQITINLSIDHRKLRMRRRALPIDDSPEMFAFFELATSRSVKDPGQVLENQELLEQINRAIEELPAQQRAVILLHEVEGLSKKMISEILQCSLVTVRTNLHHARKKLRKTLSRYLKG
ncbi:MAG: sigma-70 family RNA polymerase sigma factor [candidate division KSB1 bacterium]|nr:sigma-70 family RNA polymerase sigma factor [candidate division KSB1 bacterium]MDQ7066127.1 sigma-70 family RNA polymerase sigma factor [candidate division KSB1 bacterium]